MINTHAYCNVKCKFCVWRELSLNGFPVEQQICSYMYTYRVKRSSMRWTQSKLLIWRTSYRFQVKVTIRCVYIVVFWGINLELTILKLMLNAVYCKIYKIMFNVHMFKKKFGMLQENIDTNAKSCEICNEKNPMFFFGKIRFRKKFVSTYLHCLNVATPLEFKFTLNGKWNSLGDLKVAQH